MGIPLFTGKLYVWIAQENEIVSASKIQANGQLILLDGLDGYHRVSFEGLTAVEDYVALFFVISSNGDQSSSDWIATNSFKFTTQCCRYISIAMTSSILVEDMDYVGIVAVSEDVVPSTPLQLLITVTYFDEPVESPFIPSTITIGISSSLSLSKVSAGNYTMTGSLVGDEATKYEILYDGIAMESLPFVVQTKDQPLPAPVLQSAIFSDDGSYLVVTFSHATDKGGLQEFFVCSKILNFPCAQYASCSWLSPSKLKITVSDRSDEMCVTVDDMVKLVDDATLRAECTNVDSCSSWPTADTSLYVVASISSTAIVPSIVLNIPQEISSCSSLVLDVAASLGSGGRRWNSATISVSADPINSTASNLDSYLASSFQVESPTVVPSTYLTPDTIYYFTVTLCNFLYKCGSTSASVDVKSSVSLSVSIAGSKARSMTRDEVLSLFSTTKSTQCGDEGAAQPAVQYNWTVWQLADSLSSSYYLVSTIKSTSNNPGRFLLPAYSLLPSTVYKVVVSVSSSSNYQTFSEVLITVGQGSIVANIAGSTVKSIRKGESMRLDGSGSYDVDTFGLSSVTSKLIYKWTCVQIEPYLSNVCDTVLTFDTTTASVVDVFAVAGDGTEVSVVEISLTCTDFTGLRVGTTTVTVSIVPPLSAVLTVSSTATFGKVNPGSALQLIGTANVPSGLKSNLSWSVESSTVDMASIALSPVSKAYSASSTSDYAKNIIYLALSTSKLTAGQSYTFSLTCVLPVPGVSSISKISVTINSPPSLGSMSVSPSSGEELTTLFMLSSNRWIDEDLPLTYEFGYVSTSGQTISLRSRSESAYCSSTLPAGTSTTQPDGSSKHILISVAKVYDSYLAISLVQTAIEVTEKTKSLTTTDIVALVNSITSWNSSQTISGTFSHSVDDIKQATAMATYLLNKIDCSNAPNCTALNRKSCSRVANTCGECSSNFLGDSGDANTPCYSATLSDWQIVDIPKTCVSNCSNHGSCTLLSVTTGQEVSDCNFNDVSCKAICQCYSGYFGDICSLSTKELELKRQARDNVINALVTLVTIEDVSEDTASSMISSLVECSQNREELSSSGAQSLLELSLYTLVQTTSSSVVVSNKASLLSVVNNIGISVIKSTDNSSAAILTNQIVSVLDVYGQSIGAGMVPSQDAVIEVTESFRLLIATSVDSVLTMPKSTLETFLSIATPQVALPNFDYSVNGTSQYYQLHQLSLALFSKSLNSTNTSQTVFNSLSVRASESPCLSQESCSIELVYPLTSSLKSQNAPIVHSISGTCENGKRNKLSLTCPDGPLFELQCNGTYAEINMNCPVTTNHPSCASIGVEGVSCSLVASTHDNITCSCKLPTSSSTLGQRYLLTSNVTTDSDTTVSVDYVAMMSSTVSSMTATIVSAQSLGVGTLRTGWLVVVTLTCFLAFISGAMIFARSLDLNDVTVKPAGSTHRAKSGPWSTVLSKLSNWKLVAIEKSHSVFSVKKHKATGILSFAEEALPRILGSRSLNTKVKEEMKHHHRWLAIVYTFSKRFPRMLRVLSLSTNIIIMLFVQSITYNLSHGDDGTCEGYDTESACLADKSAYETGASKCYWTMDDDSCHYVQPDSDIKVVIFVAILSAVISTPFAMLADWMIQTVLAAPTLIITGSNGKSNLDTEKRFSSVLPISDAIVVERRSSGGPIQLRRTSSSLRRSKIQRDELKEQLRLQSEKEFSQLVKALQMYRTSEWPSNTDVRNDFHGKFKMVSSAS